MTFSPARSMTEIVPSCALATQTSLWSGETSKPLGTIANANHVFVPIRAGRRRHLNGYLIDNAHCTRADIGGNDLLLIVRNINHVGAVLAGADNPVDFVGGGIVASNGFGGFGGEPGFTSNEGEPMWTVKRAKVDRGKRLLSHQVTDRKGVESTEPVI